MNIKKINRGLRWWLSGEESALQRRRHGLDPWSEKIPRAAEHRGLCAATTEPRTTTTEPRTATTEPCATTAGACAPGACALQQERPPQREACEPQLEGAPHPARCLLQLEKSPSSNEDPAQPKIKNK